MSQFKTKCPHCGITDRLFITKVTMFFTGRKMEINVPLEPNGFCFDANDVDIKDCSTTDEEVTCRACNKVIPLSQLTN